MRLREFLRTIGETGRTDLLAIAGLVLGATKEELIAHPEREVSPVEGERIAGLAGDRRRGRPLAYITGEKEFFSEDFFVSEAVLIPRPETEIVVEEALKIIENNSGSPSVADVGTGSGVLAVTLAKRAGVRALGIDCSAAALAVARKNVLRHGVAKKVGLLCGDLFDPLRAGVVFDLVVANLPYVPTEEWRRLGREVREYEPRSALDGGSDGLAVYRRFLSKLRERLARGGSAAMEVGGAVQAAAVERELRTRGFEVRTRRDLSDKPRVVIGTWKSLL